MMLQWRWSDDEKAVMTLTRGHDGNENCDVSTRIASKERITD